MTQKVYDHLKKSWKVYLPLMAVGALSTDVEASAIERMTTSTGALSALVKGPLGEAALIVGSLGGAFGAFMKGNMWLAIGIFMVGMLFSWHLQNITAMFPGN